MSTTPTLTLAALQEQFKIWRSTKTHRNQRIPEALWSHIEPLLAQHSVSTLTQTLQISATQLKAQFPNRLPLKKINQEVPLFVNVPVAPLLKQSTAHQPTLTLERADGVKLSLFQVPESQLTQLLQQFMGSTPCCN